MSFNLFSACLFTPSELALTHQESRVMPNSAILTSFPPLQILYPNA